MVQNKCFQLYYNPCQKVEEENTIWKALFYFFLINAVIYDLRFLSINSLNVQYCAKENPYRKADKSLI